MLTCSPLKSLAAWLAVLIIGFGMMAIMQEEWSNDRVYRICKDCGMYEPEIDQLIEQVRSSGLNPKEAIQLWKDTAEPDAVELCRECVESVVGVAGYYTKD